MGSANLEALKKKLADGRVKPVSSGVVDFKKDEAEGRRLFEFAKALGFENITAEPDQDALDLIDSLAKEFRIKVAIHNHPKPTCYWDAQTRARHGDWTPRMD